MTGGMQSAGIKSMSCFCGKETSKILQFVDKAISIHFTKKSTYWHILSEGHIIRTFKKPLEWN